MSNERKDGGPAFPTYTHAQRSAVEGMTLRDYFAAKAMHGLMTNKMYDTRTPEELTFKAYTWADLMLKARER